MAEDLGELRPEVLELRDHYNLKGMKIFQFIFDPLKDNSKLTEAVNTIMYTGTHDNSTLIGWYQGVTDEERHHLREFFHTDDAGIKNAMLHYVLQTNAEFAILPVQDVLGLDESSRLNTPGTVGAPNWEWKLADFTALENEIAFMAQEVSNSGR